MVFLKVYEKGSECIVALCDESLLGKVFKDEKRVLDLKRFASFYGSTSVAAGEAKKALLKATSINAVGKESVALVAECGLVKKSDAVEISGVPHVQAYRI